MSIFNPNAYGIAGLCVLLGNATALAQGAGPAQASGPPIANEIMGSEHRMEVYVSDDAVQALYIRDAQFVENHPATMPRTVSATTCTYQKLVWLDSNRCFPARAVTA